MIASPGSAVTTAPASSPFAPEDNAVATTSDSALIRIDGMFDEDVDLGADGAVDVADRSTLTSVNTGARHAGQRDEFAVFSA